MYLVNHTCDTFLSHPSGHFLQSLHFLLLHETFHANDKFDDELQLWLIFFFLHFVLLLCQFHVQSTKAFSISTSNTIAASSLHVEPLYTRLNCKSVSVRPGWILGISVCGLNPLLVALQKPKWAPSCGASPRRFRCAQAFAGTCVFDHACSTTRSLMDSEELVHIFGVVRIISEKHHVELGDDVLNQCYFPPESGHWRRLP